MDYYNEKKKKIEEKKNKLHISHAHNFCTIVSQYIIFFIAQFEL